MMDIFFNRNLIEATTERALLFNLPKSNSKFWFPKSLVSLKGSKGAWVKLYLPDGFQIRVNDKEHDANWLYERVKGMSDSIESSIGASKQKKVQKFISKQVKLENAEPTIDSNLID